MLAEEAASSFVTFFPDRNPRWVLGRAAARPLEATLEFGQVSEWPGGRDGGVMPRAFALLSTKPHSACISLGLWGPVSRVKAAEASPETWGGSLLRVPAKCSPRVCQQWCPKPKLEKDRKGVEGVGGTRWKPLDP